MPRSGWTASIFLSAALATTALARNAVAAPPRVASINLCADQHVLALAEPSQILTVSWLAADPEESLFAEEAARYPLNHGAAEELLAYRPDVVIAGTYTSPFTRGLLERLHYPVVTLAPENSVADIAVNVRRVATALEQHERGERAVADIEAMLARIAAERPAVAPATVVVRPGGFTVGAMSLADELMRLAGMRNVAAEQGLDRWGSLSMEALVRSAPDLLVLTGYRTEQPSLANHVLTHPALARLRASRPTTTVDSAFWACGLLRSLDSARLLQRAVR
jgi:iron complex transport system substrate-binding protein